MIGLLLPRTEAGVPAQLVGVVVVFGGLVFGGLAFAVRRNGDLLVFVGGLTTITAAWSALRAVH